MSLSYNSVKKFMPSHRVPALPSARGLWRSWNAEYLPIPGKAIWLLFDTSNGDRKTKRYVWWFDTKKAALAHKRWQLKKKYSASLSQPMRFVPRAA